MTYPEEINKLRRLLRIVAYPRRGTIEEDYDRYELAALIHNECELEDLEMLNPETYYAHGRYNTEEEAKEGLDTCAYAGKWKSARENVGKKNLELTGPAHWDAVRLLFLELGGTWQSEVTTPVPIEWNTPLERTPIPLDYREPQRVRQA